MTVHTYVHCNDSSTHLGAQRHHRYQDDFLPNHSLAEWWMTVHTYVHCNDSSTHLGAQRHHRYQDDFLPNNTPFSTGWKNASSMKLTLRSRSRWRIWLFWALVNPYGLDDWLLPHDWKIWKNPRDSPSCAGGWVLLQQNSNAAMQNRSSAPVQSRSWIVMLTAMRQSTLNTLDCFLWSNADAHFRITTPSINGLKSSI